MALRARHATRGQATLETAVFLPVFLIVLFGVIWAVQSSVLSERAQIAVRFSGLISDEADPYQQYSLGALYDGLPGIAAPETYTCSTPGPDALTNNPTDGTFPGPQSPTFFQPASSVNGSCTPGPTHLSGGTMQSPMLFVHTQSTVQTSAAVPGYLQSALGSSQNISATQNFFDGPDMETMLTCYSEIGTAVEQSLARTVLDVSAAPTPLPDTPNTSPLVLSNAC